MILDTTFLIDIMQHREQAVVKLQTLLEAGEIISIAAPSVFELFVGVAQCNNPEKELERVHQVLEDQTVWSLDAHAAEEAGRIQGQLASAGNQLEAVDALIAGIALQHAEPILTRNLKDFSRIRGLRVESY